MSRYVLKIICKFGPDWSAFIKGTKTTKDTFLPKKDHCATVEVNCSFGGLVTQAPPLGIFI